MKRIKLDNRDGDIFLVEESEGVYNIECPDWFTFNVAYDKDGKEIKFIDPTGGYPIGTGTIIEGMEVKKIDWNDKLRIYF